VFRDDAQENSFGMNHEAQQHRATSCQTVCPHFSTHGILPSGGPSARVVQATLQQTLDNVRTPPVHIAPSEIRHVELLFPSGDARALANRRHQSTKAHNADGRDTVRLSHKLPQSKLQSPFDGTRPQVSCAPSNNRMHGDVLGTAGLQHSRSLGGLSPHEQSLQWTNDDASICGQMRDSEAVRQQMEDSARGALHSGSSALLHDLKGGRGRPGDKFMIDALVVEVHSYGPACDKIMCCYPQQSAGILFAD
jgi:hypothetical protein